MEKFQNFSKALIPWIAFIFTIVFGWMEMKNHDATLQLVASNFELAKQETKVSLIPLLTSNDPRQRIMALELALTLDDNFAGDAADFLLKVDRDKSVAQKARLILERLSQSPRDDVRRKAEKSVGRFDILRELGTKSLFQSLNDAQAYIDGGSPNGDEEAIKLYHEVIEQFSPTALKKLDQNLLAAAGRDYKEDRQGSAARKYQVLFSDFLQLDATQKD